jgi:hypothetical protein
MTRRDGAAEQGLRHSNDTVAADRPEKQRVIPVDVLYVGSNLYVGWLPKESEAAIVGVKAEKMGFDRLRVWLVEAPDQRRVAVAPSRHGIGREDLVIFSVVRWACWSTTLAAGSLAPIATVCDFACASRRCADRLGNPQEDLSTNRSDKAQVSPNTDNMT